MRARIYPLALGKIIKHAISNLEREVAGLLIGKHLKRNDILEVWDAITGDQKSTPGFVYLEEDTIAAAAEWVLRNRPGLYIVGWYHSHPGFSIFLSAIDIETQKIYQRMFPKAIALVVDPLKYAQTRKLKDLKFSVFRINSKGQVTQVAVSIGIQRQKLLESTLRGIETMELKYIKTRRPPLPREEPPMEPEYGNKIGGSLSSLLKKVKDKVSFQP